MKTFIQNISNRGRLCLGLAFALALAGGAAKAAHMSASAPALGAASDFAVLSAAPGGSGAVTCTNSSIDGDVGSSGAPVSVVQTSCTVTGDVVAPVTAQVLANFNTAYTQYADIPCTGSLWTAYTGQAITLAPGVYCNSAAVTFTDTTLTLDAQGNPNAVWIFKIGTGGTGALTGTNLSVVMANGGEACNVTWWVAQATTMTTSGFMGTVLSGAAITVTGLAGSTTPFEGDILATAAVTLTDVTVSGCDPQQGNPKPHKKCRHRHGHKKHKKCNQGVGNGPEKCDPGHSNHGDYDNSNDEHGGKPGKPGRRH